VFDERGCDGNDHDGRIGRQDADARAMSDAHTGDAAAYWGAKAAEYDGFIRRVVPRYDEMADRLLETLPPSPRHVLELGCGTGNVSLRLLAAAPGAALTLVDAAPEMLAITRARIEAADPAAAQRARFVEARFEALPLERDAYDAIVACISLHHVADPAPVFRSLRACLKPAGALCLADGYAAADPGQQARHMARWHAFWRQPGNLSEDEIVSVRSHVEQHDHYFDLETVFALLHDAGFDTPDCVWRDGLFAVVTA
jgi:tRNA (cmo5U34)-methyltransferase